MYTHLAFIVYASTLASNVASIITLIPNNIVKWHVIILSVKKIIRQQIDTGVIMYYNYDIISQYTWWKIHKIIFVNIVLEHSFACQVLLEGGRLLQVKNINTFFKNQSKYSKS